MIVETVMGGVALSNHAVDRYRDRVDAKASVEDVARALLGARFVRRSTLPAWTMTKTARRTGESSVGAFVTADIAFPVRAWDVDDGGSRIDYVVTTCLLKPRRPKAEVRAWRERRAEGWAA